MFTGSCARDTNGNTQYTGLRLLDLGCVAFENEKQRGEFKCGGLSLSMERS